MTTPPPHHDNDNGLPYADPDLSRFNAPWHLWPHLAAIHFVITLTASLFAWVCSSWPPLHVIGSLFGLLVVLIGFPGWLLLAIVGTKVLRDPSAILCCALPPIMIINSITWGLTLNCLVVLYRYWQHKRALQSNRK